MAVLVAVLAIAGIAQLLPVQQAYAHFFGETVDVGDGFQVVFAPYPPNPVGDNNSTTSLNFSVLQNGNNVYNVHSAVVIADKKTGKAVEQIPYRQYEISDITIPYVFKNTGDYTVTLQTIIPGDAKYQDSPLVASFDLSVVSQIQTVLSDRYVIGYIVIAAVVGVCGTVAVYAWRRM
jgi:hypothetical protein